MTYSSREEKAKKRLSITCCSPGRGAWGRKASKHKAASCVMMSVAQEITLGEPVTEGNHQEVTVGHVSSNIQQVESGASVSSTGASIQTPTTTATEDEDESEDESDILEESPCGRWQKRREEVR